MKKIITLILVCFLTACQSSTNSVSDTAVKRYNEMISILKTQSEFKDDEENFSCSSDIAKIDEGYRYYVFIDNPKIAMYNVEAIVIVDGYDYSTNMASNVGIFDETKYNLVPGQVKIDDGYAEGIMLSGTSESPNNELYLLVQWRDVSLTNVYQEFIHLTVNYSEAN